MKPATRRARRLAAGGLAASGLLLLGAAVLRRARAIKAVARELRHPALLIAPAVSSPLVSVVRAAAAVAPTGKAPEGTRRSDHSVPRGDEVAAIHVVTYERTNHGDARPALLWMHGGGFVMGAPGQDVVFISQMLDRMDLVFVSVDYRLAPEHPYPAALEDCHAALTWLHQNAALLGVDPARIAIGGGSAGGGLAAALAQRAVDHGPVTPAMQLLVYPMLDDRTTERLQHEDRHVFLWDVASNRMAWKKYLNAEGFAAEDHLYAVPARRERLSCLPAAWIGVGRLDLFHRESVEYGDRLRSAGVDCTTIEVDGAYHCFDVINPAARQTRDFYDSMASALQRWIGRDHL